MHTEGLDTPIVDEYLPAAQSRQTVAPEIDHVPVKPLRVPEESDVNVTLRNPVDELYLSDELTDDPESLAMRSVEPVEHAAVSHWKIDT